MEYELTHGEMIILTKGVYNKAEDGKGGYIEKIKRTLDMAKQLKLQK